MKRLIIFVLGLLAITEAAVAKDFYPLPGTIVTAGDLKAQQHGDSAYFTCRPISDAVFKRMNGVTYKEGCPVSRDSLRYLTLLYKNKNGLTKVGEMVLHVSIASDVLDIMHRLYKASYRIERVRLACDYGGDDELSMTDNNTSAFNFRTIAGSKKISMHGYGKAVDINPLYNPYWKKREGKRDLVQPEAGRRYVDRTAVFPYKITRDDLCCRLFLERGFTWGGDWHSLKDYQHFERK